MIQTTNESKTNDSNNEWIKKPIDSNNERMNQKPMIQTMTESKTNASNNSLYGFLGFFLRHDATYASSSRKVEGFNCSMSISISSGFESFNVGSLAWIINTIRPSFSPANKKYIFIFYTVDNHNNRWNQISEKLFHVYISKLLETWNCDPMIEG